jgi:thiamine transport system permease protein
VLRLDVAASLAFTQLLITLALGWFSNSLQRRASTALDLQPSSTTTPPINPKTKPTAREVAAQFFLVVLITLLILAPLGALVLRSLNLDDAQGPLHFYASLGENSRGSAFFVAPLVAVRNSLAFACTTAIVAVLMGIPLAYELGNKATRTTRLLELLLLLPLGTSAITLGLGLFIAFDFPIDLRASPLMLPLAHTLLALPFVVRALLPATRAIGPTLREAAAQLGATPLQVLRFIDLPLIAKPVLAAAAFAFAISLGEFGASLLVSRPEFPTMPIVIANLLGRPGALNYGQAMAMCTLLMLVTMTSVALSDAP